MRALAPLILALLIPSAASADTFLVTGSGTWDDSAPTTTESAPGAAWSFSFEVATPLAFDDTATFSNFAFQLDGTPVDDPATFLEFFTGSSSGLFDLAFANNDLLTLFGDQVFDASGSLTAGVFAAEISILVPATLAEGTGSGRVTIGPASDPTSVPEPSSFAAFAIGLMAVSCAALWRGRTSRRVGSALLPD
jgi:hypothetical protein